MMHKLSWINRRAAWSAGLLVLMVGTTAARTQESTTAAGDPAALVNPLIGTTNGGNDYPGATLPLGMLAWSPEEPRNRPRQQVDGVPGSMRDDPGRPAAPGGYEYTSNRISGFSLTHLMGTGCAGASGDIPLMPYTGEITSSPADDLRAEIFGSTFSHDDETAQAGYYKVKLQNGVTTEPTTSLRTGSGRFTYPAGKPAVMLVRSANSETGSSDAHIKIDAANRVVSGSVTSGNFCGYLGTATAAATTPSTSLRTSTHPSSAQTHGRTPPSAPTPPMPPAAPPTATKDLSPPARVPEDGSSSTPRTPQPSTCA